MKKEAYILIGCPGSGKSTYVHNVIKTKSTPYVIISSDAIRKELFGDLNNKDIYDKEHHNKVFNLFDIKLRDAINSSVDTIILDAMNLSSKGRIALYNKLNKGDYLVKATMLVEPLDTLYNRQSNPDRDKSLSKTLLKNKLLSLNPPMKGVDCDDLEIITTTPPFRNSQSLDLVQFVRYAEQQSITAAITYLHNDWYNELQSIKVPHETPYHKESVNEHIDLTVKYDLSKLSSRNKGPIMLPNEIDFNNSMHIDILVIKAIAALHDLGKGLAKNEGRYFGHENLSAVYAALFTQTIHGVSEEMKDTLYNRIVNGVRFHMEAHKGLSKKLIEKYKLSIDNLLDLELFARIDSESSIRDTEWLESFRGGDFY